MDDERGRRRAELDEQGAEVDLAALVGCLVVPYAALLASPEGRSYLRIVAQLRGRFAAWRVESDAATTRHLAAILDEIEARSEASPPERAERVLALIIVLTGSVAERARRLDEGDEPALVHDAYVDALVRMCSAVVAA